MKAFHQGLENDRLVRRRQGERKALHQQIVCRV